MAVITLDDRLFVESNEETVVCERSDEGTKGRTLAHNFAIIGLGNSIGGETTTSE